MEDSSIKIHYIAESDVFETGLYANVYKDHDDHDKILIGKYYDSPHDAKKNIDKVQKGVEYLFTAKMTDKIFKFDV